MGTLKKLRRTLATDRQPSVSMNHNTACIALQNICFDDGDDVPTSPEQEPSFVSFAAPIAALGLRGQQSSVNVCASMLEKV